MSTERYWNYPLPDRLGYTGLTGISTPPWTRLPPLAANGNAPDVTQTKPTQAASGSDVLHPSACAALAAITGVLRTADFGVINDFAAAAADATSAVPPVPSVVVELPAAAACWIRSVPAAFLLRKLLTNWRMYLIAFAVEEIVSLPVVR